MREQTARGLEAARSRTLQLTDFDETELTTQHSPLMSPLVWDLAHIGQQEDLWLLRGGNAGAQGLLECKIEQLYDAFEHPRCRRAATRGPPAGRCGRGPTRAGSSAGCAGWSARPRRSR